MNRPPTEYKRVSADRLRAFAGACLQAAGMPADHAQQLADLLTNSDLRGVRSHGTNALYGYCRAVRDRRVNPTPDIKVLKETDNAIFLDGDGGLGYAPMMQATAAAIIKAKEKGVAVGGVCHIGHYGSAGHYVRRAMAAGCTAYSVQGAHPQYYQDIKDKPAAYYGNPPLCFGMPGDEEPPMILDGATCIMADYQRGEEYDALQEMIPAAFFKSMGYTGIGTLLGGAFVGMGNPRAKALAKQWPAARLGGMIAVMDIGLFVAPEEFRQGVDALVKGVRQDMTPLRGYQEATLPGTVEHRNEAAYSQEGIPLGLDQLERLENAGKEFNVTPPWTKQD